MAGKVLRRFFQNKLAGAGTIIIGITIFTAVFAVLISPDKSEHANDIKLQIAASPPGFNVKIIKIPAPQAATSFSPKEWFLGLSSSEDWIPISDFSLNHSARQVIIKEYSDDPESEPLVSIKDYSDFSIEGEPDSAVVYELIETQYIDHKFFLLGTDRFGRDMLSRMFLGARISLAVGFIAVAISLLTGIVLGCVAGYFGGKTDAAVMWLINVVWSMPTLLLVIAFSMALGKGFWQIFVAVGLSMWVDVARMVRGQVMSLKEKEFIEAAKVLGFGNFRIIFKHILPNITGPVTVIAAANFASAILLEAGLSFLGLGVQPPMPSWGMMIKEHFGYIVLDSAYLAIVPGLAIMLLVMSFNFLGNGLRDALDVKMK